jgi:hypothetical protein
MHEDYNFPERYQGSNELLLLLCDIAGLEDGFKPASIFYAQKLRLPQTMSLLRDIGYAVEVADFVHAGLSGRTVPSEGDHGSFFPLYVSRYRHVAKELKLLYEFLNSGSKDTAAAAQRIGSLLGYPECCTRFVLSSPKFDKYTNEVKNDTEYQALCRYLALKEGKHISYLLNNFNLHMPRVMGFNVCNYSCEKAEEFSLQVLDYVKRNRMNLQLIKKELCQAVLHFSFGVSISFEEVQHKGVSISYKSPKLSQALPLLRAFEEGNSFEITQDSVLVFKEGEEIGCVPISKEFDAIFVEFE